MTNKFVKNCKFIPEMKKLLEKEDSCEDIESELHKYRQTVLMLFKNNSIEKKYKSNQSYFFALSFYDMIDDKTIPEEFYPISWSMKLNKIAFQCLALRDWLIFPLRIINIEYLISPLAYEFDIEKQEFYGYFNTRFTDNYSGINIFDNECRDKFYFIYRNRDSNDGSGKEYRVYYFTGNPIWFELSIVPYYKVILCEINWIYYTFIIKYETIPHFYKYINDDCEIEIVVSKFSLEELRRIYEEKGYDISELDELIEVFYNHFFYKREKITDKIFVDEPILQTEVEKKEFIDAVLPKNKIII